MKPIGLRQYKELCQTSNSVFLLDFLTKNLLKTNGLSKIASGLTLRIHSRPDKCLRLWKKFTNKKSLFESWDFRVSFSDAWEQEKYFLTLYRKNNPIGLLPLCYDSEKRFEWFGTEWQEENKFYKKDKNLFPLLFAIMPYPIRCLSIIPKNIDKEFLNRFEPDDPQFFVDLKNFKSIDKYLVTLSKKHRYNFKRDYQTNLDKKPEIRWGESIPEQLKYLEFIKTLSLKRFGATNRKSSSQFRHERYFQSFVNVVKNQKEYSTRTLVIKMRGAVVAVDLIAEFNKKSYLLQGASNLEHHSGLGNFICYLEIEDAI